MDTRKDSILEGNPNLSNYELVEQYLPKNPYTITPPGGAEFNEEIPGIENKSGFLETLITQAKELSPTYAGYRALKYDVKRHQPTETLAGNALLDDPHDESWTPKTDVHKFVNVDPQYYPYLMAATGPIDQDIRLQRIHEQQENDRILANGSWMARLLGGLLSFADPMSYIPVAGWTKYGKLSTTFIESTKRALPGMAGYGVLSSATENLDKINGSMESFITDSFVRTAFGTVLFGGLGSAAYLTEKMNLWNLQDIAKQTIKGIDYKFATDKKGVITGIKAIDNTGSLSAADVSYAQDIADAQFAKMGVFKVKYLGEGLTKLLGAPVIGSPLVRLINSKFSTVRSYIDHIADHSFITENILKGKSAPKRFDTYMAQEFANLNSIDAQMTALHLEWNGLDIKSRAVQDIFNIGINIKTKALELLGKELGKNAYRSKDEFYSQVEKVLLSKESSESAQINEAANIFRKHMDNVYSAYRKAYDLPEDWLPPRTSEGFLMRVYDTPYLNTHEKEWIKVISTYLKDSDEIITNRLQPIKDIEEQIAAHQEQHEVLINTPNVSDELVKASSDEFAALKLRKQVLDEQLQDELRENPEYHLLVEDWNALSATEAGQIKQLTKRRDIAAKEVNSLKKQISAVKSEASKRKSSIIKAKTVKTARKTQQKVDIGEGEIEKLNVRLEEAQREFDEEEEKLQELMHAGKINKRFYYKIKNSQRYQLRDPNERLKFREVYGSEKNMMSHEAHAKHYYNAILNQSPEDTIAQVMGRFTGNAAEDTLQRRSIMIPDEILYKNNFMTKDLMAKVSNYTSYLSRRTHLKNVFRDVTIDGGIEPLIENLNKEYEQFRSPLNDKLERLKKRIETIKEKELGEEKRLAAEKRVTKIEKKLVTLKKDFERAKKDMNHYYTKMMGIQKNDKRAVALKNAFMSFTAMANLGMLPLTMINDLSAVGLQHGLWPFIRDGIYPLITSLGGILKTKDSEALRRTAPSIHLALQDVRRGYEMKNWESATNPYLNMGKFVSFIQNLSHASAKFTGTAYIDNGLQRFASATIQSEIMRMLHAYKDGTIKQRELNYLRKYGINPTEWAERMITAFNKNGGGKTKLGGYQSHFWQWDDVEAANLMGDAVFRGVKDTILTAGIADAPMWTDENGPLGIVGSILKGFSGWSYASLNRYLIPTLQQPDAQKLLGVMFMLSTGAMVDPLRRIARGEEPIPENQTDAQFMWSAINNSGYFSFFANVLSNVNVLSNGRLLGDLKNDKYRDRSMIGLLGPGWGTAKNMKDIISALATGEMNESDAKKMARMIPYANASWTYWMSKKLIETMNLPKTRAQAHALKEIS